MSHDDHSPTNGDNEFTPMNIDVELEDNDQLHTGVSNENNTTSITNQVNDTNNNNNKKSICVPCAADSNGTLPTKANRLSPRSTVITESKRKNESKHNNSFNQKTKSKSDEY